MSGMGRTFRYLLALPLLGGCELDPPCSSKVLRTNRDISSDRYAVTEVRDCGATTSYVTVVRVGRTSASKIDAAEVFVADGNHGAATDGGGGAIWTNVLWMSPGQLSIVFASKARVFKRERTAQGATISYRAGDPLFYPPVP